MEHAGERELTEHYRTLPNMTEWCSHTSRSLLSFFYPFFWFAGVHLGVTVALGMAKNIRLFTWECDHDSAWIGFNEIVLSGVLARNLKRFTTHYECFKILFEYKYSQQVQILLVKGLVY